MVVDQLIVSPHLFSKKSYFMDIFLYIDNSSGNLSMDTMFLAIFVTYIKQIQIIANNTVCHPVYIICNLLKIKSIG